MPQCGKRMHHMAADESSGAMRRIRIARTSRRHYSNSGPISLLYLAWQREVQNFNTGLFLEAIHAHLMNLFPSSLREPVMCNRSQSFFGGRGT